MALQHRTFDSPSEITDFTTPSASKGFIKFPAVSQIQTGATITLSDGSTAVTFEVTRGGAPGVGNTALDIQAAVTIADVVSALSTAVSGTALTLTVTAEGSGNDAYASIENQSNGDNDDPILTNNGAGVPFEVQGLSGGSAGITNTNLFSIIRTPANQWILWWTT